MRQHYEVGAEAFRDPRGYGNSLLGEDFGGGKLFKVRVLCEKVLDDCLIFFKEHGARGVHDAAARLHEFCGFFQNGMLQSVDARQFFRG